MIPPVKINFYENDINEIQQKITEVLQSGMLTLGKYGKQLEEEFASLTNSQHAISTANGTCSIEIILRCLNLKDKEVILPTNTFLATYLAAKSAGCKIKFVDCEEDLNMSLQQVKDAITENTAAVILVHIGGAVAVDTMAIASLCEDKNIYLVEDAAHAHGSYLNGKHAGTFGIAGSFSFYPTKVITSGEGGIIITDNEDIAQRAKVFRDQGKAGFLGNIHTELGYNWRMSELHAVVGIYQVRRLLEFTQQRRDIAKVFDEKLSNTKFKLHKVADPEKSNYYKYILYLPEGTDRVEFKKKMRENGVILGGEVYELPIHLQPVVKDIEGTKEGDFPKAEKFCSQHICLPVFPGMTEDQVNTVIEKLIQVIA